MDKIADIVSDTVAPLLIPDIYLYAIEDKTIVVVEVYPSISKPYFLKLKGKLDGTYIRVGATNKKADLEYIQDLERQRFNISFDEDTYNGTSIFKNIEPVMEVLSKYLNRKVRENDLINFKLIKKISNEVKINNALPILMGYFDNARIKCARFKGKSMEVFIDRKEFTENIFEQVENTINFVLTHINLHGEVHDDYIRRVDSYEIPPEALREAIINAVIHRDYSITGSDIKLAIFDDKIEITSSGVLPKGITIDEILDGRSEIRNKVLIRIFKEAGFIEQWGMGIQKIMNLCEKKGLKRPEIIETGMFVKVILYREVANNKNRTINSNNKNRTINSNNKVIDEIIKILEENPEITRRELSPKLDLSEASLQRILSKLKKMGKIKRIGSKKGGYWQVME